MAKWFRQKKLKPTLNQSGSILLVALFIIALLEIVIMGLAGYHLLSLRFAGHYFSSLDGMNLAIGGEALAKELLIQQYQDAIKNNKPTQVIINLPHIDMPFGYIEGVIIDVQGMFNLNNLTEDPSLNPNAKNHTNNNSITTQNLSSVNNGITPFQRTDSQDSGSENINPESSQQNDNNSVNSVLLNFNTMINTLLANQNAFAPTTLVNFVRERLNVVPYLSTASGGNPTPFSSITELRAAPGMPPQVFEMLLPHLFVIPEVTPLNVNSATAYSFMLLSPELDLNKCNELTRLRDSQHGFSSLDAFLKSEIMKGLHIDNSRMTTRSQYYLATINIRYQDVYLVMNSLLKVGQQEDGKNPQGQENGKDPQAKVIWRSFGSL